MNVAIRGETAGVAGIVEDCGGHLVDPATADLVLTVGRPAVLSLADQPPSAPVLPTTPGGGVHAVARDELHAALTAIVDGDYRTVTHPILALAVDDEPVARAVEDAMLITAEPARISEYGVATDTGHADRFRADGVVVATPLGSDGYARAAGGPTLTTDAGLAVVPVAPFSTHARTWVSNPPVTLTVQRDEGDVTLLADDREITVVPPWEPVELAVSETFELVRIPKLDE